MEAMRTASKNTRGPMKICLGEGIGLTARMLYPAGRRMRASGRVRSPASRTRAAATKYFG